MKKAWYVGAMALTLSAQCFAQTAGKLEPIDKVYLKVPEPSDMAYDAERNSFWVVSDNGILFELNTAYEVLRQSAEIATDLEGVAVYGDYVLCVDETYRKVLFVRRDNLNLERAVELPYLGGRNQGYESLAVKPKQQGFYLITERNPIWLMSFDAAFNKQDTRRLEMAEDISAAVFHQGHLWLLSDEDRMVFKCDAEGQKILSSWKLDVLNPEGLCFDASGKMYVVSDDRALLYIFQAPK